MLSVKKKYQIWVGFLENVVPGQWYEFTKSGKEKEEILEAFRLLHSSFGIVQISHDESRYARIDPLSFCREVLEGFSKPGGEEIYDEVKKEMDDFYTKSYYPENLEAQRKYWDESNLKERQRRGVNGA